MINKVMSKLLIIINQIVKLMIMIVLNLLFIFNLKDSQSQGIMDNKYRKRTRIIKKSPKKKVRKARFKSTQ
jgi:hypothetical protein